MTYNKPQAASEIVAALEQSLPPDPRLCDLVNALGERAGGLLLVAMAIPAMIPAPGVPLGTVFGTILVIIACRMMASGTELGLPHWVARVRLGAPMIALLSRRGPALLRRVEGRLRPRVSLLVAEPITLPLALVVALMGFLIALPIPFGNTLPGFAVILLGLGLAVGDGLAVLGALILAIFAIVTSLVLGWAAVASVVYLLVRGGWRTCLCPLGANWRKPMPVFKRELAFAADRPAENTGDWWHLVLDTAAPGLYVEHTWMRASPHFIQPTEWRTRRNASASTTFSH